VTASTSDEHNLNATSADLDALELTRRPETPPALDRGSLVPGGTTDDWQRFNLEPTEGDPLSDEEVEEEDYVKHSKIMKLGRVRSKAPTTPPSETLQEARKPVAGSEWLCDDNQQGAQLLFDESQEKDMLGLPTNILRAHAMVYLVKPILEERARKEQYKVRFISTN
jgi:hypothetical protein